MDFMKHFECPEGDWSLDSEDDVEGYVSLYVHETTQHPGRYSEV